MNSPLGFVGFLTELSCPLTSCSLLSSSLLFSRVSSSLDLPTLPFFPAVHEKMTKDVTDLESTWWCSACLVQGHIETKSGTEANSAERRGRNKPAEYFLGLHLMTISHWQWICYFMITWLAVCSIKCQKWSKKVDGDCLPELSMPSLDVSFCPQLIDIHSNTGGIWQTSECLCMCLLLAYPIVSVSPWQRTSHVNKHL